MKYDVVFYYDRKPEQFTFGRLWPRRSIKTGLHSTGSVTTNHDCKAISGGGKFTFKQKGIFKNKYLFDFFGPCSPL